MAARHDGQVAQVRSQASTQGAWKPWPQPGSTRRSSPSANSARQMAHSEEDDDDVADVVAEEEGKERVGSASMAFFLSPLGGGSAEPELLERRRLWRRHAQRETRARPRTQTSAQRSEARITTMSESTDITGAGEEGVSTGAEAAGCRRLAGARMVCWLWGFWEIGRAHV